MDTAALAAWVTSVITGIATGVGSGLGSVAADQVSRVARQRLGADEDSRRVLERFDGDPAAPGAEDDLRTRLLAVIEQDPDFAARLRNTPGLPVAPPGALTQHVHVGRDVKNGVIAIGPVSIRKTPGAMAALAIVTVIVLAFAVNGVVNVLNADDRPAYGTPQDAAPSPATGHGTQPASAGEGAQSTTQGVRNKAAVVGDTALTEAIAPDLQAMPSGWSLQKKPFVTACIKDCSGRLYTGGVVLEDSSGDTEAVFNYWTYDSVDSATAAYQRYVNNFHGTLSTDPLSPMSLAQIGDNSTAYSSRHYDGAATKYKGFVILRVGTVIGQAEYNTGYDKLDTAWLAAYARLLADRAQQAQNGQTPSARAAL